MNELPPMSARARLAFLLLFGSFVAQASLAAFRDSVTIDEFVHLPIGLYMLETRDFDIDPINPPLSRMIPALPLLLTRPVFSRPAGLDFWPMGLWFMVHNTEQYQSIYVLARSMIILLTALAGVLVFHWARRLYGPSTALVALFLFAFSPSILANGHLVTVDGPAALGFLGTSYFAWRLIRRPTPGWAAVVGASLGVSVLLKLSCMALSLVVGVIVAVRAWREREGRRWLGLIAVAGVTTIAILNLGYGFEGSFQPLGHIGFPARGKLIAWASAAPGLRLPLPAPFLKGVDLALSGSEVTEPTFFLAGELSQTGWWYYHLLAYALKTPLSLLVAEILALSFWLAGKSRGQDDSCVYVPILAIFASNALFNPLNIGVRHVLPAEPLLCIAVSPLLAAPLAAVAAGRRRPFTLAAAAVSLLALVWFAASSVSVAPRYLEYFNEAAGGPEQGHRWLIDSNLDWGQDLIRLSEYMKQHHLPSVNLAYFGTVHPGVYGVRFQPLDPATAHGPTVISASFLMGRPYGLWYSPERRVWAKPNTYAWLRRYSPVGRVGSMFVYDLP